MSYAGWEKYMPPGKIGDDGRVQRPAKKAVSVRIHGKVGLDFPTQCRALGLPLPVPEWRVCSERRWRYDFAWPSHKLALEVQGGLFVEGRHNRGASLLKEHEKLNMAALLGYRVVFTTPKAVASGDAAKMMRVYF